MLLIPTLVHLELINTTPSIQDRKIIENEKRCRNGVPKSTQTRKDIKAGLAAMVRPVRPWPYRFLKEKNGVDWILLLMRYRMASPSGSP